MSKFDPDDLYLDACQHCDRDVYSSDKDRVKCNVENCDAYCHRGCLEYSPFTCNRCVKEMEKRKGEKKKKNKRKSKQQNEDESSYKENSNNMNDLEEEEELQIDIDVDSEEEKKEEELQSDVEVDSKEDNTLKGYDVETETRPTTATSALSSNTTTSKSSIASILNKWRPSTKRPNTANSNQSPSTGHQAKKPSRIAKFGNNGKYPSLTNIILYHYALELTLRYLFLFASFFTVSTSARAAVNSISNLLPNDKECYNGSNTDWKKHHKNIIIRQSLSRKDQEKLFKQKRTKSSYIPHPDATNQDNAKAENHWAYQALAGPNSPLTATGHVVYRENCYYKNGHRHDEVLKILIVKNIVRSRKQYKNLSEECAKNGTTVKEQQSIQAAKGAEEAANIVLAVDVDGFPGAMIEFVLTTMFKDPSISVKAFGKLFTWLMEQGQLTKFTHDEVSLSMDGYIQKDALFSSVGGNDHDCVRVDSSSADNKVGVTTVLATTLLDMTRSELSADDLTGKMPKSDKEAGNFVYVPWYAVMLLSRVADIYSSIGQPNKFFRLLRLLPTARITEKSRSVCHLGQVCHSCNNGITNLPTGTSPCVNPDCLRFGTSLQNTMDDNFYKAFVAVCNSNEYSKDEKCKFVSDKILMYKMEMNAMFGREVDIVFQRKTEFEKFKAAPSVATATEVLKRYLPIGVPGYESLTPDEVEDDVEKEVEDSGVGEDDG